MRIQAITEVEIAAIAKWEYPDELSTYNHEEIELGNDSFFAVYDEEDFTGFGVSGVDAIVQGLEENAVTLDIGLGMAPHLIRKGLGKKFGKSVLSEVAKKAKYGGYTYLRCAIYSWNTVSLHVAKSAGFNEVETIVNSNGEFIILKTSTSELKV